jgi:CelD/BcsL family acetyltransferase involved in cellulose biosynthesis
MPVTEHRDRAVSNLTQQSAFDYSLLTDLPAIAGLSAEWDELLARSRCNRAFSCSKWYLATPQLLPDLEPLVLVARRNGLIAGILPLWLDTRKKQAGFPDDYSDHLDIIAVDEDTDVIASLLNFAIRQKQRYDQLSLKHIKPDSNCARAARMLGLFREEAFAPGNSLPYAVLDLTGGYDRYVVRLSRQFRRQLKRLCAKAQKESITVSELKPESFSPQSLPEIFLRLHESRFGTGTSLTLVCKSPEKWIYSVFPELFAERRMRVFAISIEDRIAAIDVEMVARSGMYSWNGGFLPEIEQYHPGKLLIRKAIEQCCIEGLTEYDLGWFGQEYKMQWRPEIRQIGELQFHTEFQPTAGH